MDESDLIGWGDNAPAMDFWTASGYRRAAAVEFENAEVRGRRRDASSKERDAFQITDTTFAVPKASDWLFRAFGFKERLRIGDHRAPGAVLVRVADADVDPASWGGTLR